VGLGLQQTLFLASAALWAMSVPLAILLLGVLFLRLAVHQLPPKELAISTWISLGTLGTGIMGLALLGHDSQLVFASLAASLDGASLILALILWGFGVWWLFQSIAVTLHYVHHRRLPFNIGWWGLTFPLGVFDGGTDLLFKAFPTPFLADAGRSLFVLLALFWMMVAYRTLRSFFEAGSTQVHEVETPTAVYQQAL
jgi:tellurite resistance protein TehA-like permease